MVNTQLEIICHTDEYIKSMATIEAVFAACLLECCTKMRWSSSPLRSSSEQSYK
jgi:hypothetical protein